MATETTATRKARRRRRCAAADAALAARAAHAAMDRARADASYKGDEACTRDVETTARDSRVDGMTADGAFVRNVKRCAGRLSAEEHRLHRAGMTERRGSLGAARCDASENHVGALPLKKMEKRLLIVSICSGRTIVNRCQGNDAPRRPPSRKRRRSCRDERVLRNEPFGVVGTISRCKDRGAATA